MTKYIHEFMLPEKDEFSEKFNYISWLWQEGSNSEYSEEKRKCYRDEHWSAKYCLEQGLPILFLNEYKK